VAFATPLPKALCRKFKESRMSDLNSAIEALAEKAQKQQKDE
jgi:hypothetical protein